MLLRALSWCMVDKYYNSSIQVTERFAERVRFLRIYVNWYSLDWYKSNWHFYLRAKNARIIIINDHLTTRGRTPLQSAGCKKTIGFPWAPIFGSWSSFWDYKTIAKSLFWWVFMEQNFPLLKKKINEWGEPCSEVWCQRPRKISLPLLYCLLQCKYGEFRLFYSFPEIQRSGIFLPKDAAIRVSCLVSWQRLWWRRAPGGHLCRTLPRQACRDKTPSTGPNLAPRSPRG